MTDIKSICSELHKGKNVDKNLSLYLNEMMSYYNRFSYIKFSMNYYSCYDLLSDMDSATSRNVISMFKKVNTIIETSIINTPDKKRINKSIDSIMKIRNSVIDIMDIITAYVDRLAIYEHILNRVEFRFSNEKFDDNYYDSYFANDIVSYILSDKDNVVINGRIAEVISQLPMRLTRSKFFEIVKESMMLYRGNEKSGLDDFEYMLNTVSGIHLPEGMELAFPNVRKLYDKLAKFDYKTMNEKQFKEALDCLNVATDFVTKASDVYVQFMEMINDLAVILLSAEYAFCDNEEKESCVSIIKTVLNDYNKVTENENLLDDLTDMFIKLEGKQEKLYSVINSSDYMIDEIKKSYEDKIVSCNLIDAVSSITNIALLSSGSHFVNLNKKEVSETVTDEVVNNIFESYYNNMSEVFKENSQLYNRAVMSAVLGSLPVFFNNADELMTYINTSLSSCTDLAEKKACVYLIGMILEDNSN